MFPNHRLYRRLFQHNLPLYFVNSIFLLNFVIEELLHVNKIQKTTTEICFLEFRILNCACGKTKNQFLLSHLNDAFLYFLLLDHNFLNNCKETKNVSRQNFQICVFSFCCFVNHVLNQLMVEHLLLDNIHHQQYFYVEQKKRRIQYFKPQKFRNFDFKPINQNSECET